MNLTGNEVSQFTIHNSQFTIIVIVYELKKMKSFFITGTDTEVGKTWFSLGLIQYLKNQGLRVAGMKPISSGCYHREAGLRNHDAENILAVSGLDVPYDWVNPYAFSLPIAPHLAAAKAGQTIDLETIMAKYRLLTA